MQHKDLQRSSRSSQLLLNLSNSMAHSMLGIALLLISLLMAVPAEVHAIGVCYGMIGDNLPQPGEVVALYQSNSIQAMRIYYPRQDIFQALQGSNIQLILDVPRENLQSLAADPSAASDWVQQNIAAYPGVSFRYVSVGNEVISESSDLAQYVLPAMQNIQSALSSAGLQDQVKVSTAVSTGVLATSYPPSSGAFNAQNYMNPIVQFLSENGAPLLLNVYPYFSYIGNPSQISLSYALFTSPDVVVQDEQLGYQNLFDAIVDAVYASLEKAGGPNVEVVVSESGWPSAGGFAASVDNAQTYNQNLIRHVGQGTPRRSGRPIEAYIFAMFNENQKDGADTERNFGLFYPDKQPVYPITFS